MMMTTTMMIVTMTVDDVSSFSANAEFLASFKAVQPAMAAMIFRAVHKISEHAVVDQTTNKFSVRNEEMNGG
jgi:chromate transport protein ChrA